MIDIDYIMELLDWNRTAEEQAKGIELAKEIKHIGVFVQPITPYGKRVWENCAKVIVGKSDEELQYYLEELLEWLQDLNWPGALLILERLEKYQATQDYRKVLNSCLEKAKRLCYDTWESNINSLISKMKDC